MAIALFNPDPNFMFRIQTSNLPGLGVVNLEKEVALAIAFPPNLWLGISEQSIDEIFPQEIPQYLLYEALPNSPER